MKWLLDTNVVSDGVRDRPYPAVSRWIASVAHGDAAISIVTYAELWDGATSAVDEAKRRWLTEWVELEIRQSFHGRTLPLTADILIDWLRLSRKLSARRVTRDASDLLIAATARVHSLILVTRNVRDFADTGVLVYDPWTGETHRMERP